MYIIGISDCCESRMSIHLIFVMLHARKTLCNVTKAQGAYMHEVDYIYHQAFFVCASAMDLCDGFMRRLANWLRSENINAVSRRQDSDSWTGSGTGSLQLSYRELQVLAPPICPCMADSYYQPSSMAMTQLPMGLDCNKWDCCSVACNTSIDAHDHTFTFR